MKYYTSRLPVAGCILFALLSLHSCNPARNIVPELDTPAASLPLLSEGNKLGMIVGFNASNPPATTDSIEARWEEAIDAGMSVGRLQIDWPELEPEEGQYDRDVLENALEDLADQGVEIFLTVSAYDSDGPVVPTYLEGNDFDNGLFQERFNLLMDWVVPMLRQYNGWVIAISNEPDNAFGDDARLADQIIDFLQNSREHIHGIEEDMAVTVTMNEGNLEPFPRETRMIAAESDVVSLNYYGTEPEPGEPFSQANLQAEVDEMLEFSGEKSIIFQELGMYSGSTLMNSSEEIQADFFEAFFTRMEQEPRLRAAVVFQLVDWEPATTEIILDFLRAENVSEDFVNEYGEVLNTLGLIKHETGESKLAWDVLIRFVKAFR